MTPRRDNRPKLGELLASRGKLDRTVLLEALRRQRAQGGRLGTCLLELDAVQEDDLLHVLSDQLKLPFLEADDLRAIPDEALRLVPVKVAVARGAVPVRASGTQLTVAMLDPHDLSALDEIAFVSGRRIRPHIALELRIQEVLARAYHVDIPMRFVTLLDRLNRARHMWKPEAASETAEGDTGLPVAPSAAATPPVPPSPYPPLAPRPGERRPATDFATSAARPTPAAPAPPTPPAVQTPPPATASPPPPSASRSAAVEAPPPSPITFAQAELRLQEPRERDDVANALIDFLRPRADIGLLLMIRRREAAGWRAHGVAARAVAELRVDLGQASVVHALRDGAPLHRGPLPPLRGNEPLRALLGAGIADLLALPLSVRERPVGILIAASRRAPLAVEVVEDLQRLAVRASSALELLVLRRKLRKN